MKNRNQDASITVFLSLVLIVVLALVGTMIETARIRVARRMEERALKASLQSVFTEYYRPLYDDYHLFFMGKGTRDDSGEQVLEGVREYMGKTFDWQSKEDLLTLFMTDLYSMEQKDLTFSDPVYAVDEHGQIFLQETTAYMKYKAATDLLEKLLDQMGALKSTEETAKITQKKLKLEAEMGELDQQILKIIEKTEGLSCGRNGLKKRWGGKLKTESYFAKMFSPKGINQSAAGISNSLVWESVRDKYVDPEMKLRKMENYAKTSERISKKIRQLEEKLEKLDEDFAKLEDPKPGQIKNYERKVDRIYEQLEELEEELEEPMEHVDQEKDELVRLSRIIKGKMEEILPMIDELESRQEKLCSELSVYGKELEDAQPVMDENSYQGFSEDYGEKEQYLKKQEPGEKNLSVISRITGMREVFLEDMEVLESFEELDQSFDFEEEGELEYYESIVHQIRQELKRYDISRLSFDYSTLSVKEQPNPLEALKKLLDDGVMGLVCDNPSAVSKAELPQADACYQAYGGKQEDHKKGPEDDYGKSIKNMDEDGYQDEIGDGFGALGKQLEVIDTQSTFDKLISTLLLNEYIMAHHKNVGMDEKIVGNAIMDRVSGGSNTAKNNGTSKNSSTSKKSGAGKTGSSVQMLDADDLPEEVLSKPSVLRYEAEYIINGEKEDDKNFRGVVNKIIFIRTILNFIYLLTDSGRKQQAYMAAAALVGVTGLEALVRLVQGLILIAWAYEEAIVDAAFLVGGMKVPIIKTKDNFQLTFPELFCLSRTLIKSKMEKSRNSEGKGKMINDLQSLGYESWLRIFLLIEDREKRCMRSMDLIEANMKLRNNKEFVMGNMLYGANVQAEFSIPSKFASLPFVLPYHEEETDGWQFDAEANVSY